MKDTKRVLESFVAVNSKDEVPRYKMFWHSFDLKLLNIKSETIFVGRNIFKRIMIITLTS